MKTNFIIDSQCDYAIYPSLLDAYLRYKRHDDDDTFAALFDKINKAPTEQTDVQRKGVVFEQCVNDLIEGKSVASCPASTHYVCGQFLFKIELINKIADKLRNCKKKQYYIESIMTTKVGKIRLYGIADYAFDQMIVDLKTTGNYKINKYTDSKDLKYTQHLVYSKIRKEMGKPLDAFKYVVSDFENDFQETFIPTQTADTKLMQIIFEFVAFINYYKANITDGTVFGGREAA
jgi:hypothetical protein